MQTLTWVGLALISAFFAGLTAVLGKLGVEGGQGRTKRGGRTRPTSSRVRRPVPA